MEVIKVENEKDIVYLYGFSTRKHMYLENLLGVVRKQIESDIQVAVVFLHDGVKGTSQSGLIPTLLKELINLPVTVYALLPDLLARGIKPDTVVPKIKCIEYGELVDLLALTPKVASWM